MGISSVGDGDHFGLKRLRQVMQAHAPAVPAADPKETFTFSAATPSPDLRKAYDGLFNAGGTGTTMLLEDNSKAWNARWRALESAQHTINTQYFCWDRDVFGMAYLGHIFKKVRGGQVYARMMVDATGDTWGTRGFKSHIGGRDYMQEVVGTGHAEAKVYHPHYKKVIDQLLHPTSSYIAASNHDKILEVDGERGVTGGRNIGYEYFVDPRDFKGAWRDTDVYFESPAAAHALRSAFEVEYGTPWINDTIHQDRFGNWVKRDLELLGAYSMMDIWLKEKPLAETDKNLIRSDEEARQKAADALVDQTLQRLPAEGMDRAPGRREMKSLRKMAHELVGYTELRGSYNQPQNATRNAEIKILDKTSAVGVGTDQISPALGTLASVANKRIIIENPYVVLTDDMRATLRDAGKRGVEIWLGTNSPSSTDSDVTQAFFLDDWPRILAETPNMKIFVATGDRKLHAKTGVVDDTVSLVSTYNLDLISRHINGEVAALVWSPEFAHDGIQAILKDQADPRNGVVEYTIKRDASGTPVRSDGKPVLDATGQCINDPEITFGPENHLSAEVLEAYKHKREKWRWIRNHLPQFTSVKGGSQG